MKKLILILALLCSTQCYGQITYITKTFEFSSLKKDKWVKEPQEICKSTVEIDSLFNTITVHTNKVQRYSVYEKKFMNIEGGHFLMFWCTDDDGIPCSVEFTVNRSSKYKSYLKVKYADLILMYNIEEK